MKLNRNKLLNIQKEAEIYILEAGKTILDLWNSNYITVNKDNRDITTNVDIKVENFLRTKLKNIFPEAGFIVEEGISDNAREYIWAIDPIDGTKQYNAQLPMFLTQIALLYRNEPILGIVYNPISQQLFSASQENGTYLNKKQIQAKTRTILKDSIIDLDLLGFNDNVESKISLLNLIFKSCYRVRATSGFMRSYIVTGAIDASIRINTKLKKQITDISSNLIIAKEAGLVNHYVNFENISLIITAHPKLVHEITELLL